MTETQWQSFRALVEKMRAAQKWPRVERYFYRDHDKEACEGYERACDEALDELNREPEPRERPQESPHE